MPNAIVWFDIPTTDFDRAVKFYSDLMGSPVNVQDFMGQKMGFFPVDGEGVGGDILPPMPGVAPSETGTRIYINADGRIDELIGRVEGLGGRIVQPKTSIGNEGWFALFRDSEGNIVGLHSNT